MPGTNSENMPGPFPAPQVVVNLSAKALLFALPLFLFKGTARWPAGWLFWGLFAAWSFINAFLLYRRNPRLLRNRLMDAPEVKEPADKVYAYANPALYALTAAVCAAYGGWPAGPLWLAARVLAFAGLACAYWLSSLALLSNSFALKAVLLQPGQTAVSAGPYAVVRHPLYAAFLLFCACAPAALGSARGYLPAAAAALLTVWRTAFEDRFLARGLAGYAEYSARVKFRLVPGVW